MVGANGAELGFTRSGNASAVRRLTKYGDASRARKGSERPLMAQGDVVFADATSPHRSPGVARGEERLRRTVLYVSWAGARHSRNGAPGYAFPPAATPACGKPMKGKEEKKNKPKKGEEKKKSEKGVKGKAAAAKATQATAVPHFLTLDGQGECRLPRVGKHGVGLHAQKARGAPKAAKPRAARR